MHLVESVLCSRIRQANGFCCSSLRWISRQRLFLYFVLRHLAFCCYWDNEKYWQYARNLCINFPSARNDKMPCLCVLCAANRFFRRRAKQQLSDASDVEQFNCTDDFIWSISISIFPSVVHYCCCWLSLGRCLCVDHLKTCSISTPKKKNHPNRTGIERRQRWRPYFRRQQRLPHNQR